MLVYQGEALVDRQRQRPAPSMAASASSG